MKYLITFFMLLNYGYAQVIDSIRLEISPKTGEVYGGLTHWSNGSIEIEGDTMAAIRSLLSSIKAGYKREEELWSKIRYYMRQQKQLIKLNDNILQIYRKQTIDMRNAIQQLQANSGSAHKQSQVLTDAIDRLIKSLKQ